ncbi:MAG: DUF2335 domain-containing protein [Thermoanaerobaculia bacterium]
MPDEGQPSGAIGGARKTGTSEPLLEQGSRAEDDPREEAGALLISATRFSGPLPPPEVLSAYQEALPGSAERIIQMAEEQGTHRRQMESRELAAQIKSQTRGQYLASIVALLVSGGGIYLLAMGQSVTGLVALLTPLAGLVGLFLVSRSKKNEADVTSEALKRLLQRRQQPPEDTESADH